MNIRTRLGLQSVVVVVSLVVSGLGPTMGVEAHSAGYVGSQVKSGQAIDKLHVSQDSVPAANADDPAFVWIEAESATVAGQFEARTNSNASAGSFARVDSTIFAATHGIELSLTAPTTREYDMWVLGTPANVNWASGYSWAVDGGTAAAATPLGESGVVYNTADYRNVPIRWQLIATVDLSAGTHTISMTSAGPRSLDSSLILNYFDVVALTPSGWGWAPEGVKQPKDPGYRWVEGERTASSSGGFSTKNLTAASNGKALVLDAASISGSPTATYDLSIDATDSYDIWILSTDGNVNWASNMRWRLDSEQPTAFNAQATSEIVYTTADSRQVPLRWYRLSAAELSAGTHALAVEVAGLRTLAPSSPLALAYIDAVVAVPSSWGVAMNALNRPFDPGLLDLDYVGAENSVAQSHRGDTFSTTVTTRLVSPFEGSILLRAELVWHGQTVTLGTSTPIDLSTKTPGQELTVPISLKVPFNAPGGELDVQIRVVNAEFTSGAIGAGSSLQIGEGETETGETTLNVDGISAPVQIVPGAAVAVAAEFALSEAVNFDTTPYLAFTLDGALRGIAEADVTVATSTWAATAPQMFTADFPIPDDLPAGTYEIELGLHRLASAGANSLSRSLVNSSADEPKPLGNGRYIDGSGQTHLWYVTQTGVMTWDGRPFIPVGGMWVSRYLREFDAANPAKNQTNWAYDVSVLNEMSAEGVKDIYVNAVVLGGGAKVPAWAWQFLVDALDEYGFTYGLQFNSFTSPQIEADLLRTGPGASAFRVTDITANGPVNLTVDKVAVYPNMTDVVSASYVVIDQTTGEPVDSGTASVERTSSTTWAIGVDLQLPSVNAHTVTFTPRIATPPANMQNFWDDPDAGRAPLLSLLENLRLGSGFRLFVDPSRNEANIVNRDESLRIHSISYDASFADWLERKYGNASNLNAAWSLEPLAASFAEAARLVPQHTNGNAGPGANTTVLRDSEDGDIYTADAANGVLWDDNLHHRADAYRAFNNDTADAIKAIVQAPVIYKYTGAMKRFFVQTKAVGGFDGLGGEIYGEDRDTLREKVGYSFSAAEQSAKTLWLLTTETQLEEDVAKKAASGLVGYPDKQTMFTHFDNLIDGGEKGIYDFLFDAHHDRNLQDYYTYSAQPERYDWLREYRETLLAPSSVADLTSSKPDDLYYLYPGGQTWWLQPNERTAVLDGSDYDSHGVLKTADGKYAVSTFDPGVGDNVLIVNLQNAPATTVWGDGFDLPALLADGTKVVYVGLRDDLGSIPALDAYFTQERRVLGTGDAVQVLDPTPTSEVLYADDGHPWALRDGNLWIVANGSWHDDEEIFFLDEIGLD